MVTILTRVVGINLIEKMHLREELKELRGLAMKLSKRRASAKHPAVSSLHEDDPCLLGFTPLRAGFRRKEKNMWWK